MRKNLILSFALLLIVSMPVAPVHADEVQFTTIDVRTPWMGGPAGNAFQQEAVLGGNVKILIDSGSSGNAVRIISHANPFDEAFHIRIVAQEISGQQVIPRRNWPYTGVSYSSMKVDFLTTDAVLATFVGTDRFITPRREGDVSIRVLAETNVDERKPPREVRKFTFKVTLQDVQGIKPDGSRVNLGNFIVLFHDQIIFMHDPAQIPEIVICGGGGCGGGVVHPLEEISATSPFGIFVEAGTGFSRLITTMQEYMVYLGLAEDEREFCDASDNDCPTGVDEEWSTGGDACDESDVDECEEEPIIIGPINPGDNLTPNQGNI